MVSFDITSLFTNIPLNEVIHIILNKLFHNSSSFYNFSYDLFKSFLEIATHNCFFLFNQSIYQQVDGVAMGSPLGPTLANIFMCHLENIYLQNCPNEFKPVMYKRYVDDTFALFTNKSQAEQFFNYINSIHPNISFTAEHEDDNKLSFLDVLISRTPTHFTTSIYRKPTFTTLSTNFFSAIPYNFKINSIKTLLHRAYHLCSNWSDFHSEIEYLANFFRLNSFPDHLLPKLVNKFLSRINKTTSGHIS